MIFCGILNLLLFNNILFLYLQIIMSQSNCQRSQDRVVLEDCSDADADERDMLANALHQSLIDQDLQENNVILLEIKSYC